MSGTAPPPVPAQTTSTRTSGRADLGARRPGRSVHLRHSQAVQGEPPHVPSESLCSENGNHDTARLTGPARLEWKTGAEHCVNRSRQHKHRGSAIIFYVQTYFPFPACEKHTRFLKEVCKQAVSVQEPSHASQPRNTGRRGPARPPPVCPAAAGTRPWLREAEESPLPKVQPRGREDGH